MESYKLLNLIQCIKESETLTANEIGQKLGVSDRTVRNYMKELNKILELNGGNVESKSGVGYKIVATDSKKLSQFMDTLSKEQQFPTTSGERVNYIVEYFLMNNDEVIKIEDLMDELFVSKSTIITDLKEARKILKQENMDIVFQKSQGYQLDASEYSIRLSLAKHNQKVTGDITKKIAKILRENFNRYHITINDMAFENLCIHIEFAIIRIQQNQYVMNLELDEIRLIEKMELVDNIVADLENIFLVRFSKSEKNYIAIHLSSKETISENIVIDEDAYHTSDAMIKYIHQYYSVDFSDDLRLRMVLAMHLIPFAVRIKHDMLLRNPILTQIKEQFSYAFLLATAASSVIEKKYQRKVDEHEIAYFALHFNLALERKVSEVKKINVLLVCTTGRGSAELLAYQFSNQFKEHLNEIKTCEISQISLMDLNDIDYIITTVDIEEKVNIPILKIHTFLENRDIETIHLALNQKNDTIESYLSKDLFFTDICAETKEDAIDQIVSRISKVKEVHNDIIKMILRRESNGATEFGNLVAIPHPDEITGNETYAAVSILKKPIKWLHHEVQFIFMLVMGNDERELKKFFPLISSFLMNKEAIEMIIESKDYNHMLDTIKKLESKRRI